jgi:hypothetical protein
MPNSYPLPPFCFFWEFALPPFTLLIEGLRPLFFFKVFSTGVERRTAVPGLYALAMPVS